MPYACSYEVPADARMHQRVKDEIGDGAPEGRIAHLVVKSDGGLRHITVWDSQANWERFRDDRVQPAIERVLRAVGFTQIPPRPAEQELEVVDVMTDA